MLKIIYAKINTFIHHNLNDLIVRYNLPLNSQKKINSYYQVSDRYRAFVSELFKYNILADYLNISLPQIKIQEDDYYRPYLANQLGQAVDFNLSHSGDYVIMAVSNKAKVGIDIEFIDHEIDYASLKSLTFSCFETELINSSLEFFNLWSKKEALIKVVGKGFLDAMYQNTRLDHDPQQLYSYALIKYKFCELKLDLNYKTYLCYTYTDDLRDMIEIEEYTFCL